VPSLLLSFLLCDLHVCVFYGCVLGTPFFTDCTFNFYFFVVTGHGENIINNIQIILVETNFKCLQ